MKKDILPSIVEGLKTNQLLKYAFIAINCMALWNYWNRTCKVFSHFPHNYQNGMTINWCHLLIWISYLDNEKPTRQGRLHMPFIAFIAWLLHARLTSRLNRTRTESYQTALIQISWFCCCLACTGVFVSEKKAIFLPTNSTNGGCHGVCGVMCTPPYSTCANVTKAFE